VPAQFNHAGQLTPILAGLADCKGGCFIYGEHGMSLDLTACREQAACCPTLFHSGHSLPGSVCPLTLHNSPIIIVSGPRTLRLRYLFLFYNENNLCVCC